MQSATVLIVEDDRELQQRLFAQTRGHGYTALAARPSTMLSAPWSRL